MKGVIGVIVIFSSVDIRSRGRLISSPSSHHKFTEMVFGVWIDLGEQFHRKKRAVSWIIRVRNNAVLSWLLYISSYVAPAVSAVGNLYWFQNITGALLWDIIFCVGSQGYQVGTELINHLSQSAATCWVCLTIHGIRFFWLMACSQSPGSLDDRHGECSALIPTN